MLPLEVGGPLASIRNFLSNLEAIKIIQDAIKDFDEAIKLDPMFSWSFLYRGFAFEELNRCAVDLEPCISGK